METWNLTFTAKITQQNRIVIPSEIVETTKLKTGTLVTLTLNTIHRKGGK